MDYLFPKYCFDCNEEGEYWCVTCQAKPRLSYPNICFGCQKQTDSRSLCLDCQPNYAFDGIWIATDYENSVIKDFIRNCKYRFVSDLSHELSLFLKRKIEKVVVEIVPNSLLNTNFFKATVIAIPLSKRRFQWREFNQAELLARQVASHCRLDYRNNILFRSHRIAQAKLREVERKANLQGAFYTQSQSPELVILVDDVITTGATLNESAKVLKKAGAKEVWGLVVAKG